MNEPRRPTHEELLEGRVPTLSLLNEPIDFEVDYVVVERPKLKLVVNNERGKEPT